MGPLSEARQCNIHLCPINCELSGFGAYSTCSQPCTLRGGSGGIHSRSRSVITAAQHGGIACLSLTESATCNAQQCPDYCHTQLGSWTACTKSCGGGTQHADILPGEIPYGNQQAENCPTGE